MSTLATQLLSQWRQLRAQLRPSPQNRTLWLLIGLGLLAAGGELGMRAWEYQQKLDRELAAQRKRVQALQISADRVDWVQLSDQLGTAQQTLQKQLWHAPSEAQAQAMLRDWLSSMLKEADIARPTLRLQPVQPATPAQAASASEPAETTTPSGLGARLAREAVRARAQISFELAPGTLETVLQRIERGGQLASVDALSVSKRSRRVEMSVSIPVIIEALPADNAVAKPATR
ncbi:MULTISPECIES: hypothetical protein [unclassified Roseateles]|uniref:hypothetical protein n=1 Tax=unclassified Roseateles TaxID=2626991 RepID=UPI0006F734A9|nr:MULTISPECIES: hypothetical protein [unclassified Roseateles]KQW42093.1 hypothetical protein ASC81_22595 [Pelomonas sp. Root405]KRA67696.1 hypothetical protein ASD88_24180 [Pelomonas sp. Root662]